LAFLLSIFVPVLILISSLLVSGQTTGLPEGFQEGDLLDVNKVTTFSNPQSWQNLSQEWKQKLLNSPAVAIVNSALSSVNFIFLFLFGEPYSFSLLLFFVIILWIFFLIQFNRVLKFSLFSEKKIGILIAFGLTIILAQLSLYRAISGFFVKLIL